MKRFFYLLSAILTLLLLRACDRIPLMPTPEFNPEISSVSVEAGLSTALLSATVENASAVASCGFYLATAEEFSDGGGAMRLDALLSPDGTFKYGVENLEYDTGYAFCAFVSNGVNEIHSAVETFRTDAPADDCVRVTYLTSAPDQTVRLVYSNFKNTSMIDEVTIDGEKVEPAFLWTFPEAGTHTVRFKFKSDELHDCLFRCLVGEVSCMTGVSIPDKYTSIPVGTFENCSELVEVRLPETLESIGNEAFRGCSSLKSIHIPGSCTSFGEDVFHGCTSLERFDGPLAKENGRLLAVGDRGICFAGAGYDGFTTSWPGGMRCDRTFHVPSCISNDCYPENADCVYCDDNVKSVGTPCSSMEIKGMFVLAKDAVIRRGGASNKSLLYLYLGCENALSGDGEDDDAFVACESLITLEMGPCVRHIRSLCRSCPSLRTILFSENLETVGVSSFQNCMSLEGVRLPDSVSTVGDAAFSECPSLKKAYFGKSLKQIGDNVFFCIATVSSLKKLFIAAETPPGGTPMRYIPSSATVYVPEASLDAYRTSANWSHLAAQMVGFDFTDFDFDAQ